MTQPARDAVILQSEGPGRERGGAKRGQPGLPMPVRDNEVIAGQSEWRAESQLTLGGCKGPRGLPSATFLTTELAGRLEAGAYLFLDFSLCCLQWDLCLEECPHGGRQPPPRSSSFLSLQSSLHPSQRQALFSQQAPHHHHHPQPGFLVTKR